MLKFGGECDGSVGLETAGHHLTGLTQQIGGHTGPSCEWEEALGRVTLTG